jgi:ABC-type dipeptide/oligopeptide/nickel transport system permease subunit
MGSEKLAWWGLSDRRPPSADRQEGIARPRALHGSPGVVLLVGFFLLGLAAPWLAPYDPLAYAGRPLEAPSAVHWLGTNDVGQDILSELVHGTRVSLLVGTVAAAASLGLAVVWGTAAGYLGGWTETLLMRAVDVLMAMPHLPLMVLLAAYLAPSVGTTILVISLLGWLVPTRVVRAQTLSLRSHEFVHAARAMGGDPWYVVARHLLPALSPILAAAFVGLAGRAVMLEAGLAFLGLGDPIARSWGATMRAALSYSGIFFTPHWAWWLLPAGLCVSLLVLAFTLVGLDLETRLDPRLRQRAGS